jgi:hypothetical protein
MYKGKKCRNILGKKKGQMKKQTIKGQKQETEDEKENYLCFH